MLIWGPSGCGKTTLAATAPGRKLLMNFDPGGPTSITTYDDVSVLDLSTQPQGIVERFKSESDPLGVNQVRDHFDTFIFDSLTTITELTLHMGITKDRGSTIERPAPAAYQTRNALALELIRNVLRWGEKNQKHVIFIAHEGAAERNNEGSVVSYPVALGGQLPTQATLRISEVWALIDDGRQRKIAIRPCHMRRPMKTRMFSTSGEPEFVWRYDADKRTGATLAQWWDQWVTNGLSKLPLPK